MNVFSWAAAMGHQWGKPDGCTREHSKHTHVEDLHRWAPMQEDMGYGPRSKAASDQRGTAQQPRLREKLPRSIAYANLLRTVQKGAAWVLAEQPVTNYVHQTVAARAIAIMSTVLTVLGRKRHLTARWQNSRLSLSAHRPTPHSRRC